MSHFDKIKSKITDAVDEHGEKISEGLEKAGDFIDEKTGGKYSDKIDQGVDKAREGLDKLDGKEDDFGGTEPRPDATEPRPGGAEPRPGTPGQGGA